MQPATQLCLPATILETGVDWITATSKTGASRYDMQMLAEDSFHRLMDAGETISNQKRQGFTGWAAEGLFFGERHGEAMMIASGHRAKDIWLATANVADNVSRIDLQTTIWTYRERPNIAKVVYEEIKRGLNGSIPIKNATYIEGHPHGQTVNVNKRASDQSGRIYDKASEGKLGLPCSIWRYEIEVRRRAAGSALAHLRSDHRTDAVAVRLVFDWFRRRGILPLFNPDDVSRSREIRVGSKKGDTMAWFRDTLSKTVARQVEQHGRERVIQALGLNEPINPNCKEDTGDAR